MFNMGGTGGFLESASCLKNIISKCTHTRESDLSNDVIFRYNDYIIDKLPPLGYPLSNTLGYHKLPIYCCPDWGKH